MLRLAAIVFLVKFLIFLPSEAHSELVAGVGKYDLPPIKAGSTLGYGNIAATDGWGFDTPAVRVLYLSDGIDAVNVVSVDTLFVYRYMTSDIRNKIVQEGLRGDVFIVATHVHSSVAVSEANDEVDREIRKAIIESIREAQSHARPAVIGFGIGQYKAAFNRVLRSSSGSATHWEACYEDLLNSWRVVHPDPVDDSVSVLSVWAQDNSFSTMLFNYAAHPVTFGKGTALGGHPTAGYPAQARRLIERATQWPALFLQGFAGDINVPCTGKEGTEAHIAMARFGDGLGSVVLSIGSNIREYSSNKDLKIDSAIVPLENQCPGVGIESLEVISIAVGDEIAFVGISGEPFALIGYEIRRILQEMGYSIVILSGYTNGTVRYIPDKPTWGSGAYGTTAGPPYYEMCVPANTAELIVQEIKKQFTGFSNSTKN